jgi:hypothetical protein
MLANIFAYFMVGIFFVGIIIGVISAITEDRKGIDKF